MARFMLVGDSDEVIFGFLAQVDPPTFDRFLKWLAELADEPSAQPHDAIFGLEPDGAEVFWVADLPVTAEAPVDVAVTAIVDDDQREIEIVSIDTVNDHGPTRPGPGGGDSP